jgi:hypothetical protein
VVIAGDAVSRRDNRALGERSRSGCSRPTGTRIAPIRINLTAGAAARLLVRLLAILEPSPDKIPCWKAAGETAAAGGGGCQVRSCGLIGGRERLRDFGTGILVRAVDRVRALAAARRKGARSVKGPWTLPNFITLLRLAMLPFFLVAISNGSFGLALVLFVAAGISDGVDGYLARRFDMKSALGAYLDPIADKLVMMSSYVFLSISSYPGQYKIPFWLVVLVVSRDVSLFVALR